MPISGVSAVTAPAVADVSSAKQAPARGSKAPASKADSVTVSDAGRALAAAGGDRDGDGDGH